MKINLKSLLFNTLVPLMISFIIAMIIPNYQDYYESLNVPLRLPPIAFIIAWSIIYILIGISAYLIENNKNTNEQEINKVLRLYYIHLLINFSYTIVAFWVKNITIASVITILLLVTAIYLAIKFYKINKISGLLFIPYIIWLILANYIQIGIYYLN
mgnify:CR=1 FL=1